MNTFATTAASSAEYLRAFPSTTYQRAPPNFNFLLPTSFGGGGRRQHLHLQNSGKTAAASQRRTPRAFRAGGTLVVRVAMSATRLQIGIIRLVYQPISEHSLATLDTPYSGEINGIFH